MATKKTDVAKASTTVKNTTTVKKACARKSCAKKTDLTGTTTSTTLRLIKNDKYLAEYAEAINGRHQSAIKDRKSVV